MTTHLVHSTSAAEFKQNLLNRYSCLTGDTAVPLRFVDPINHADISYYGCSFTWGEAVDYSDCWTSVVDRHCNFTSNNFAIPGIGIDEIALLFRITSRLFKMSRAAILLPPVGRQTIALGMRDSLPIQYFSVIPGMQDNNKMELESTKRTWFMLPDSYYIDRAIIAIDQIKYLAQINNIELLWSSWDSCVYHYLSDTKIPLFVRDFKGSDGSHPGADAHYAFAQTVIKHCYRPATIKRS
jgi:hypothetical protein